MRDRDVEETRWGGNDWTIIAKFHDERMLRLTRVEANVDSKVTKGQGILQGLLQGTRVLGAFTAALGNDRLL